MKTSQNNPQRDQKKQPFEQPNKKREEMHGKDKQQQNIPGRQDRPDREDKGGKEDRTGRK